MTAILVKPLRLEVDSTTDTVEQVRRLAGEINDALSAFVRGQLTVCLLLGAYYATALMVVGFIRWKSP